MLVIQEQTAGEASTPVRAVSTGVYGFSRLLACFAILLFVSLLALFRIESISLNFNWSSFLVQCVAIGIAAAYCHWAGNVKLRDGCVLVLWAAILVELLRLPCYAAARAGFPLIDSSLSRADQLIGGNVAAIVEWTRLHPAVQSVFFYAYRSLWPFVLAASVIPAMTGRFNKGKEFLISVLFAALMTALVFAFFPAIGPWSVEHFQPYYNQAWETKELLAIRSNGRFLADPDASRGLITFPSFHVALSVLCAYALWPFRRLRPLVALIAVLICLSTVATGWHYVVDGIAALILASCSIWAARFLVARYTAGAYETVMDVGGSGGLIVSVSEIIPPELV